MAHVEQALAELGLTPIERKVYLELLHLGSAPASVVAKRVELPRSTVHYTCQALRRKGLVSVLQRKNTYLFHADDPAVLLSVFDVQRHDLARREEKFKGVIQELRGLRSPLAMAAQVRMFDGPEGVAAALKLPLEAMAKSSIEVLGIINPLDSAADPQGLYPIALQFVQERVARKIPMRSLLCDHPLAAGLQKTHAEELCESRILPGKFPFPASELILLKDSFFGATATTKNAACFMVEDATLTALLRALFEAAWQGAAQPLRP